MSRRRYQAALECPVCNVREPVNPDRSLLIVGDGLLSARRRYHEPIVAECAACQCEFEAARNLVFQRVRPHKVRRGAVSPPA